MEVKLYANGGVSRVLKLVSKPNKKANNGMLRQDEKKRRLAECDRQAQALVNKLLDIIVGE